MLKLLIQAFKASKGRMPNNLEMLLLKQKAANQAIDERKVVNMFDREPVNPNKPILGGKNIDETEEQIRERLIKQNEQGIANLKNKLDDPEKKAMGGRIGYAGGSKVVQGLLKALQNKFGKKAITTADKLKPPQKTLDRDMFKKFKDRNPDPNREMTEDEIYDFAEDIGGELEAYNFDGTVGSANRIRIEHKEYMDDMYQQYRMGKLDPEPGDKSEARKRFLEQKLEDMEGSGDRKLMSVDEIEELSSFDLGTEMDVAKSLAPKMVERLQLKQKYPGITDDLLDKILIDDNMQRKAEVLATIDEAFKMMEKGKGTDEIIETFKNVTRTKQADGGRIGLVGGGITNLVLRLARGFMKVTGRKPNNDEIQKIIFEAAEKDMNNAIDSATTSIKGGSIKAIGRRMNEIDQEKLMKTIDEFNTPNVENKADGGIMRAPFVGGGMGRRGFLKLLGSLGAGAAAIKTGILGIGGKQATKEVAKEVATSSGGVPPYFFKLVDKIKRLGDDVTQTASTQERQKVTKFKDYQLTEDAVTGRQEIQRYKVDLDGSSADYYGQPLTEETYMSYTPGETIIGKGGKPVKTKPEYEEGTAYIRSDREFAGEIVDESSSISDDILTEVGDQVKPITSKTINQTQSIKKASGGIARMLGE